MAKCIKTAPDWNLENELPGLQDDQRVREHRPVFESKTKKIRLSALGIESPFLASDDQNPEVMFIAHEENGIEQDGKRTALALERQFGNLDKLAQRDQERLSAVEAPLAQQQGGYEFSQFEHLPSCCGMGPRGMDVFHR